MSRRQYGASTKHSPLTQVVVPQVRAIAGSPILLARVLYSNSSQSCISLNHCICGVAVFLSVQTPKDTGIDDNEVVDKIGSGEDRNA